MSIRLGKVLGVDICLHLTFFVILIIMSWGFSGFYVQMEPELSENWHLLLGFLMAIGLFVSVTIHELAHAGAAKKYGIKTERITLFFLGAIAQFKSKAFYSPKSEFVISVVGPLSNFAIAILCFGIMLIGASSQMGILGIAGNALLIGLVVWNIALAIFNLIPAFPMDGGRILRAALWKFSGNLVKATKVARDVSVVFAILLPILSFYFGGIGSALWMLFISFFIYIAGTAEYEDIKLMELEERVKENQKNGL